ncbi:hypothetical protein [Streptomyces sp. OK228]|uniref:hypothetical protein n=1 Tax=Streptomyces sp. OK228 TaxID=1882786 RepID=UPI000BCB1F4C|nr:hypothetical protein [Streptomyces sp. OK228]SOE31697.1 hypothetical protein SAMN05442782_8627 [Streptomyces sp. OK228]
MSWEAITRALQNGDPSELSDRALAAAHGCSEGLVARARRTLRLPGYRPGKRSCPQTLRQAFMERSREVAGGHREWRAQTTESGVPVLSWRGLHVTAGRVAFKLDTGRDAEGNVKATCTYPHCVAPGHQADRPMREALRAELPAEAAA